MESRPPYHLAFSSCPNDTFIFKAIARERIGLKGLAFNLVIRDVETLNQAAVSGEYEVTKLSFAQLGKVLDQYALLRSGAALGEGCGPLLVSRPGAALNRVKKPVVAVPGLGTTAFHLFRFYMDDAFPGLDVTPVPMSFEQVMPEVASGRADFGVIIHEGRFVYEDRGFELRQDLGQWWETKTLLPIPLGCIAIKRTIDPETARSIETLIRQSINHGFAHPDMDRDYISGHAQELAPAVIQQHIDLYVNDDSKQIGERGEKAVTAFFDMACKAGLMQHSDQPLFAC